MKTPQILAVGLFATLLLLSSGEAMGPSYMTDSELSDYPVIVIATWDKAEMRPHTRVKDNVLERYEVFTELNVRRVIQGDLKPGKHKILVGWGIGWKKDGTELRTYTSSDIPGDVNNVSEPNIWFLDQGRSWDETDQTLYYRVPHYRAIQPPFLEEYFLALGSRDPEKAVPKLLTSDNHEVLNRVLRYLCGDILPWPSDDRFLGMYHNPSDRGKVLKDQAAAVKGVIGRNVGQVRATATSVYAYLAGRDGIGYLRTLLKDRDANVRAVAIGALARLKDEASIGAIGAAAPDTVEAGLACRMIDEVANWGDVGLTPALIPFLQNDTWAYSIGDDWGVPALKARQGLYKLTGHWFPYDVEAATQVWKEVDAVSDPSKRKELLDKLLPDTECPVVAEFVGSPRKEKPKKSEKSGVESSSAISASSAEDFATPEYVAATVRLKNTSSRSITITRQPIFVEQSGPDTRCTTGGDSRWEDPAKDDFMRLEPGGSAEFEVSLRNDFLLSDPKDRKVTLTYEKNGKALGLKAWIGMVPAKFGSEWKEERKLEKVEEKWPNGSLKVVGQTMNGQRCGEWQYFNEKGKLIKTVRYTRDIGSSKDNKP